MGETFAEVILKSNEKQIKKRLLVDTDATYSWISAKELKTLGVKPVDKCLGRKAPSGVIYDLKLTLSEIVSKNLKQ